MNRQPKENKTNVKWSELRLNQLCNVDKRSNYNENDKSRTQGQRGAGNYSLVSQTKARVQARNPSPASVPLHTGSRQIDTGIVY